MVVTIPYLLKNFMESINKELSLKQNQPTRHENHPITAFPLQTKYNIYNPNTSHKYTSCDSSNHKSSKKILGKY